jgi:hypothetical protein
MDLFLISQYQFFQNSTIPILNIDNFEFQKTYIVKIVHGFNIFLDFWYRHGTEMFGKGNYKTKYYNNSIVEYDIYEIISNGACHIVNDYNNICEMIPEESKGYLDCGEYLIDNMTLYFIEYINDKVIKNFTDNAYLDMVKINILYFSSLTRGIIYQLEMIVNDNVNDILNKYIICLIVYFILTFAKTMIYFIVIQKKSLFELIYIKSTLLLINPNDIKENRIIMDFLHKEMLLTN